MCLLRDADETKEWIEEKNQALNTDNYGHDLASVQALQRKHEGFERDLAALGDKVRLSFCHLYVIVADLQPNLWWKYSISFEAFYSLLYPFAQVNSLGETAERLIQSHPEAVDDIQEKCTELNTAWSSLVGRADQRKDKLGNSHDLQRFLSDFRWGENSYLMLLGLICWLLNEIEGLKMGSIEVG